MKLNGEHGFTARCPDDSTARRLAINGYKKPVEGVKLIFEDVWRGSEHEDLRIGDVQLEVALPGEPKIHFEN